MTKKSSNRELLETIEELENLLTDRISDLHDVKMGMQARHAYMYYRRLVWEIKRLTHDIIDAS